MHKFLKYILFFIPIALLGYLVFLLLWGTIIPGRFQKNLQFRYSMYGHLHERIQEVKKTHHVDILFLGSSHCYRGFDTRIFRQHGYTSFNLGSSSQSPMQSGLLLKRYLNQLNPKIIIFEVCPMSFSTDGVESSLDLISNDHIDMDMIKLAFKQNNIKEYNSLVYGLIYQWLNGTANYQPDSLPGNGKYITGGFVEMPVFHYQPSPDDEQPLYIDPVQFCYFEEIVKQVKDRKIRLILVQAPVTRFMYHAYCDNQGFDKLMEGFAEYYNYNEILQLDDSLHFYDAHHLNQSGVDIFNNNLIGKIEDQ